MIAPSRHTLAALFPDHASARMNTARVVAEDIDFTLEVVASRRINENDEADCIVWMADESKTGTYRHYQTLVILDPHSRERLEAEPYP